MNLQQLEYILAINSERHFAKAAEKCFVTQATLSMMVRKLEEELDVKIFDRSRQPVVPTETGKLIIEQARLVLQGTRHMKEIIAQQKGSVKGELKIGVIPTLAPYLLPLFLNRFLKKFPLVKVHISERTTDEIIVRLKDHRLDAGIMATPLNDLGLLETPMFYEQFVVFAADKNAALKKKYMLAEDIDPSQLWLLEEGHCLRSQVVNLCELKKKEKEIHQLDFEAGSIETLKKIVEVNNGITILPELALNDMSARQKKNIRYFKAPAPVREVSLVTYRHFMKKKLIDLLLEEILASIPKEMKASRKR
ncbi:MAG: LysR substrate-binding domain-containing protein, partial [Bacteroidota bacterium]